MSEPRAQAKRVARAPLMLARMALARVEDRRNRVSIAAQLAALEERPLLSIVMPVYEPRPRQLRAALRSIRGQVYDNWELCVVDDGSTSAEVAKILAAAARRDARIRVEALGTNAGISAATNHGVSIARGEYVAFVDQDDVVASTALLRVAERLAEHPEADAVYSDQVKAGRLGRVIDFFHKPDWSPVYALGVMYVGHLLVIRRQLVERVGGFDSTYDGIQDYELLLRVSERTKRIQHLREPLYIWRASPGSLAADPEAKPEIGALQARAVNAHLERGGIDSARAVEHPAIPHRVRLIAARSRSAAFSIVIPSVDSGEMIERCLGSIAERTAGPVPEIVVVDGGSTDRRALAAYERHGVVVVDGSAGEFNYSRANNLGVERATGELLVLLNNDIEVLDADWLDQLEMYCLLPDVGAVGAQLVYPDGGVQHAGVVLGTRGTADHAMRGFDPDADGYAGSLSCAREVSAVTAACMCVPRELYLELGGMSEEYAVQYQDVDLCLRIGEHGRSVLYVPRPRLVHHESASRGDRYDMVDRALLIDSWWDRIRGGGDPYYNPALSVPRADYSTGGRA